MEGNRTLKQEQVQSFLDHAGKVHDTKVLKGERTEVGQLFPKPVYEEPPTEQRMKMINNQKQIIKKNLTSLVKYDEAIGMQNHAGIFEAAPYLIFFKSSFLTFAQQCALLPHQIFHNNFSVTFCCSFFI